MSCKSNIYAVNTAKNSVVTDAIIPLGSTPNRRYGSALCLAGDSVIAKECGYYLVSVNVAYEPVEVGEVKIALYQNNEPVPGAYAFTLLDQPNSVSFTAIVRVFNNCKLDALTIVNEGVPLTVINATMTVNKIV